MKNVIHKFLLATLIVGVSARVFSDTSSTLNSGSLTKDYTVTFKDYTVTFDGSTSYSDTSALNKILSEKQSTLTVANFAVVTVDLAGKVVEKFKLNKRNMKKNVDGNWVVTLPGNQRADRLIVVDLVKPIDLAVASSIHQDNLIFTPTTDVRVNLTVGTTFAYKHFIEALGGVGSFADVNTQSRLNQNSNAIGSLASNRIR
jgi:hypothetical protein